MANRILHWFFLEFLFGLLTVAFYFLRTQTGVETYNQIELCIELLIFIVSTSANALWDIYNNGKKRVIMQITYLILLVNAFASAILCGFGYSIKDKIENGQMFLILTLGVLTTCVLISFFSQIIIEFDKNKKPVKGSN